MFKHFISVVHYVFVGVRKPSLSDFLLRWQFDSLLMLLIGSLPSLEV